MNKINEMKKMFIFLALVIFFLIVPNIVISAKVDSGIVEKLNDEQEVSVIVMLKDRPISLKGLSALGKSNKNQILEQKKAMIKEQQDKVLSKLVLKKKDSSIKESKLFGIKSKSKHDFELRHKYSVVNGFSGKVTMKGLEKLKQNPDVKGVYINKEVHITLDQSIPQIKANYTWAIQLNSTNITGLGETICIIDTGIDYNHTNLGDGWGNKIIGGYRALDNGADVQECASNHSACFDDHNHGTHVAGIIISNDTTYKGVAPDAKLVAIKILDNNGDGWSSDIIAGIDWCVNNASKFNISVISMSLGITGTAYNNTYCDNDYPSFASAIDSAVGAGILVAIASGNCKDVSCTAGISVPSCIQNATPVASVTHDDAIYYQRGIILDILAPGGGGSDYIYSTNLGGGVIEMHGTSMSAPHVAGAAALLKQFVRLYNGTDITPQEIEDVLNATGKEIDDESNSGRNYSRIDVYAAILSLDTTPPQYSDVGKNDTSIKVNDVVLFYANWSDSVGLSHYIFSWNHSGSWANESAVALTSWSNVTIEVNATGKPEINWKIYANDSANNWNDTGIQTFNISNSIPTITANVTSPTFVYTNTDFNLNLTIADLDNDTLTGYVQFYINNTANGSVQSQTAPNGANTLIGTLGSGNFSKDYNLTAEFWASDGTENTTHYNISTVIVQNSAPTQPSLTNPENQSIQTSVNITINWSSTDADLDSINYSIYFLNSSPPTYNSSTQDLYKTFTDLTDNETYYWHITANDGTDNSTASAQRQFTINTTALTVTFVNPTPTDGERLTDNYIYVNVTVTHLSLDISNCTLLWNSTHNYTMTKVGSGQSVSCWENITTTDGINYTYSVIANITDGIEGTTGNRTNLENTKPTITNPSINNSNQYTNDILNCDAGTFSDDDSGDSENQSLWRWYANNVLNATTQILNLTNEGLDKGIILKCSQRVADGYEWSSGWYNSTTVVTIQNTAPTQPSLNSPTDGATNQLLTVTLNITITDIDGDNMNISFYDSSNDLLLGTNNNLSSGSYATHEWSGLGYSTTYEWYVNITDGINTSQSQNWSFNTKTRPISTGGGGGGFSVTYEQKSLGILAAGSTKAVTFTKSATLAVTEIQVTVKNKVTNAKIKVDTGSLPSGASVPSSAKGSVYKYITITKTGMTDDDIEKAVIKFKIKKSWLTEKGYGRDAVSLHRYYNKKWEKLETERTGFSAEHYYYSAESSGFSIFAITAEKTPVVTAPTAEEEEEVPEEVEEAPEEAELMEEEVPEEEAPEEALEEEKETALNKILIVALIAVIIIFVIVSYFVQEKKQKKKRKYRKKKKKKHKTKR